MLRRLPFLLACLPLAACQPAVPAGWVPGGTFALGPDVAPPGVAGAPVGRPAMLAAGGSVTVDLKPVLAGLRRRLLATVADIDHVIVTLTAPGQAPRTATVLAAAISGGQTAVTLSGLEPATWAIAVAAYDAGGAVIGESHDVAEVQAGQVTTVAIGVLLAPSFTAPAGGGSAGGGSPTGGVGVGATFADGPTLESPQPLPSALVPAGEIAVGTEGGPRAVDKDGNIWVGDYRMLIDAGQPDFIVAKFAPDGTELLRTSLSTPVPAGARNDDCAPIAPTVRGGSVGAMHALPSGDVWASVRQDRIVMLECGDGAYLPNASAAGFRRLASNGTVLGSHLEDRFVSGFAPAPGGDVWVSAARYGDVPTELFRFGADGTQKLRLEMPKPFTGLLSVQADPFGNAWLTDIDTYQLKAFDATAVYKVDPAGTLRTFDLEPGILSHGVDVYGQLWLAARGSFNQRDYRILVYSNAGTKLAEIPWHDTWSLDSFEFQSDPAGRVWVSDGLKTLRVIDPRTFATLAAYPLGLDPQPGWGFLFDRQGFMWRGIPTTNKIQRIPYR